MHHSTFAKTSAFALVAGIAATIAGFSATAPTPTGALKTTAPEPGTPRKAEFEISVPLIYNGKQVGTAYISIGDEIRVVHETATTLTIWHMGREITVPKPGASGTPANTTAISTGIGSPTTGACSYFQADVTLSYR